MITLTTWQFVATIVGSYVAISLLSAIIGVVKDYHRTCPRKRMLPVSQIQVRCFKRLDHGECPDHGKVR
jgi:hypothetical protein